MAKEPRFVDLSLEIKEGLGDLPPEFSELEKALSARIKHSDKDPEGWDSLGETGRGH